MKVFSSDEKLEFISVENNIYTHKEIEKRNGITYMRMKKRFLKR